MHFNVYIKLFEVFFERYYMTLMIYPVICKKIPEAFE